MSELEDRLVERLAEDHLILYGDPEAEPPKGVEDVIRVLGHPTAEAKKRYCSFGPECPIHPDGKGGPWV